jgi:hypothetical protein
MSAAEFRAMQGKPKPPVQGPAAPNSQFALGRLPQGVMNKTEQRFLDWYIAPRVAAGDIVWWAFEGIKLKLAPSTFVTADFNVMFASRELWLFDVKGAKHLVEEDARAKLKIAADKYPLPLFLAWPDGKGFHIEPVGRG